MPAVIYSPNYDMGLPGLDRLHPFDGRKFGKAWRELEREFGSRLRNWHISVDRTASDEELLLAHSPDHLARMCSPKELAQAFEVSAAALVPFFLLDRGIVTPMKWGVRGSILAAEAALEHGIAVNLSGGYHHAKRDAAEGFCLFSDIAVLIHSLRDRRVLNPDASILYIDTDAHQGNGVCHQFLNDQSIRIYDQFNADIFPRTDRIARERIDHAVPLEIGTSGDEYLRQLHCEFPRFLDGLNQQSAALAIYNAGTDIFMEDDLGMFLVDADDVVARDRFVVRELRTRKIPVVTLLSGGYSPRSFELIARSVAAIIRDTSADVA